MHELSSFRLTVSIWHPLTLLAGSNKTNIAYKLLLHTLDVFFMEIQKTSNIVTLVIAFNDVNYKFNAVTDSEITYEVILG